MANERMFLLHRPSGKMILLGKHMGEEWYKPPTEEELSKFYESVYQTCIHDGLSNEDFVLAIESTLCRGNDQSLNRKEGDRDG